MTEKFYNPLSNETLIHRDRVDGKRDLFVTTPGTQDHSHAVLNPNGTPSYIRDFNGRVICDDSK